MDLRSKAAVRRHARLLVGVIVFVFAWLFRFNDPGGSFAGLTDDHFFYLVRGWQILFGDLPVRDFVDHGAPLYYYVGAAVQTWFGRGTLSEFTFAVTVLSAGAALTFWLASVASGSIVCGVLAVLVHILLEPRFYNYPKILVYAIAIPLLWRFADRPNGWSRFWLAAVTGLGFMFRHDHALFIGVAFASLLAGLRALPWRERLRHGLVYAALVLALLTPYLIFIQTNGGLLMYFRDASAWAARDRERAPVVWPGLFEEPANAPAGSTPLTTGVAVVRQNFVAWMFYLELTLPFLALAVLALSRDGFRPDWPRAAPKIASTAVLGMMLNAWFLRSPLAARLADPTVAHAILLAWLLAALFRALTSSHSLHRRLVPWVGLIRTALVAAALPVGVVLWAGFSNNFYDRLDKSALVERPGKPFERMTLVRRQLTQDWKLHTWAERPDRPDLITLAMYLDACSKPGDRVLVQPYIPQVLALSRRAFAGGHADLRPGFFNSPEAQRVTLERLRRQSVPLVLLETGSSYRNFRRSFPLVTEYLDRRYALAGTWTFDGRFGVQLLARKDLHAGSTFEPLDWPCFR